MTALGAVLIGVVALVVVGAIGMLKLGDWIDRRQRRKRKEEAEFEDW